ncbi:uncharacterized protein LOC106159179 [Lingula anatina]|uniref:Uncharacterized protein LOC106159179 n=1 Tax=Lingula anatina TaxID=7574 RepID=A0A1S3I0G9_LINAN|nr:uncharacterized protein LOC106159179 [Lingula anatina]|eukprot:XP_013390844.1 uncharacterized protein LOC106159179 [Lingula anatina]
MHDTIETMSSVPEWKQALIEKRDKHTTQQISHRDERSTQSNRPHHEDKMLVGLPAWKREIVEKRRRQAKSETYSDNEIDSEFSRNGSDHSSHHSHSSDQSDTGSEKNGGHSAGATTHNKHDICANDDVRENGFDEETHIIPVKSNPWVVKDQQGRSRRRSRELRIDVSCEDGVTEIEYEGDGEVENSSPAESDHEEPYRPGFVNKLRGKFASLLSPTANASKPVWNTSSLERAHSHETTRLRSNSNEMSPRDVGFKLTAKNKAQSVDNLAGSRHFSSPVHISPKRQQSAPQQRDTVDGHPKQDSVSCDDFESPERIRIGSGTSADVPLIVSPMSSYREDIIIIEEPRDREIIPNGDVEPYRIRSSSREVIEEELPKPNTVLSARSMFEDPSAPPPGKSYNDTLKKRRAPQPPGGNKPKGATSTQEGEQVKVKPSSQVSANKPLDMPSGRLTNGNKAPSTKRPAPQPDQSGVKTARASKQPAPKHPALSSVGSAPSRTEFIQPSAVTKPASTKPVVSVAPAPRPVVSVAPAPRPVVSVAPAPRAKVSEDVPSKIEKVAEKEKTAIVNQQPKVSKEKSKAIESTASREQHGFSNRVSEIVGSKKQQGPTFSNRFSNNRFLTPDEPESRVEHTADGRVIISDKALERIRKAGKSWFFSAGDPKVVPGGATLVPVEAKARKVTPKPLDLKKVDVVQPPSNHFIPDKSIFDAPSDIDYTVLTGTAKVSDGSKNNGYHSQTQVVNSVPVTNIDDVPNTPEKSSTVDKHVATVVKTVKYEFIGANVQLEKSNLSTKKEKKLAVSFSNDQLASIHEYPSEDCMLNMLRSQGVKLDVDDIQDSPDMDNDEDEEDVLTMSIDNNSNKGSNSSLSSLQGLGSGGSGLSSYKGRFQMDYQFGMNMYQDEPVAPPKQEEPQPDPEDLSVKPADDDFAWSESATSDLLF